MYSNHQTPPQDRCPTGSFCWKDILKLFKEYKKLTICTPNNGNSVSFWLESWSGEILKFKFPQLFSFVKKPKASLNFMTSNEAQRIFSLPLSSQAVSQLQQIQVILYNLQVNPEAHDIWHYTWGAQFSSSKAYKALRGTVEASPLFRWLWSSSNLGKYKFFFWLLLRDRLNTRNLLRSKNRNIDDFSCVLCNSGSEETLEHMFFSCRFSQDCWDSLHIFWDLSLDPLDMVIEARRMFGHHIFRKLMITACWIIWKMRNSIIFDNGTCSLPVWKQLFKEELGLVCIKAKDATKGPLSLWRENYT